MKSLENQVILITGGSSGMGLGTAGKLKARGAKVIIASRSEEALKKAQKDTGADDYLVMDVTKYADWEKARDFICEKYGRLDILMNNAGGGITISPYLEQSMEEIEKSINLNLYGAMYGCRVFAPLMKERREGLIINVLSVCSDHAWPGYSVYSAAKAGLKMFGKCLYLELQPYNIKVTSFIPAAANTNFTQACGLDPNPVKLTGADVADAIESICSMNDHVCVEEMTVWGIDQEVCPL